MVTSAIWSRVSDSDNAMLTQDFKDEEFRKDIFHMHKDKAPGTDGFNPAFYKKLRGSVGLDIVVAWKEWLDWGSFPDELNKTNVVLIPKCEQPKFVKDLRPISLCNVIFKILCKVLWNRLKGVLPSLIDESQSVFQSSRSIQDNILIAFDTLHAMKGRRKGKTGDVAFKININKKPTTVLIGNISMRFSMWWDFWINGGIDVAMCYDGLLFIYC